MDDPTVFLLIGFPGTGKLTVANALSRLLQDKGQEVRVIDNHYVNNPVLELVAQDGVTPLPVEVLDRIGEVGEAVYRTIETLSPPTWSFIFTAVMVDRPLDRAWFERLELVAKRRGSRFVPVRLLCDAGELSRRVVRPERADRLKSMSQEEVRIMDRDEHVLDPVHPADLTLDITTMPPQEAAERIARHVTLSP